MEGMTQALNVFLRRTTTPNFHFLEPVGKKQSFTVKPAVSKYPLIPLV